MRNSRQSSNCAIKLGYLIIVRTVSMDNKELGRFCRHLRPALSG